jgi:hypothetical protein
MNPFRPLVLAVCLASMLLCSSCAKERCDLIAYEEALHSETLRKGYAGLGDKRQVRATLSKKPVESGSLTGGGDSSHIEGAPDGFVGGFIACKKKAEPARAESIRSFEAYWVSRGFLNLGIYYDYFFYDENDAIVYIHRRFID